MISELPCVRRRRLSSYAANMMRRTLRKHVGELATSSSYKTNHIRLRSQREPSQVLLSQALVSQVCAFRLKRNQVSMS